MATKTPVPVWMDCDPGHDDAFALLLAANSPEINLLGVSIVHGNDNVGNCAKNAARFLWACGIQGIPIYEGVNRPIVREAKHCPEIHGTPGEDGVSGMCGYHFPDDIIFTNPDYKIKEGNGVLKMVETIRAYKASKVTIIATGAQTNVAMALRLFPEIMDNIERIVFMGGAMGIGNTGVAAEYNIEIDPEAAHVVLHSGLPIVMVPLEVTHTVLVTDAILERIRTLDTSVLGSDDFTLLNTIHPHVEYENINERILDVRRGDNAPDNSKAVDASVSHSSPFSNCCYELLTFFKSTYQKVFSFKHPPIHDPCAVFYVIQPDSFQTIPMYVDVEISSSKCLGRTLCDIHGILQQKPNVLVCTRINLIAFWGKMLNCIKIANEHSPLN